MSRCKARQYSDQMACECGLVWDMNDPDPPMCRDSQPVLSKKARGLEALRRIREELNKKPG